MEMSVRATKEILKGVVAKHRAAIEREINYLKELDDDKATLAYIIKNKEDGIEISSDCAYESYNEWQMQIQKEIKATESSIARINVQKQELKAFEYYIENASEEDAA